MVPRVLGLDQRDLVTRVEDATLTLSRWTAVGHWTRGVRTRMRCWWIYTMIGCTGILPVASC